MPPWQFNLLASAIIALVMWAIASVRNARWRSIIYSLPVPMTLMWIAAGQDRPDSTHVTGLAMVVLFAWWNRLVVARAGLNVWLVDALGVGGYLVGANLWARAPFAFPPAAAGYVAVWLVFVLLVYRRREELVPGSRLPAWVKALVGFGVVNLYLLMKDQLHGAVATAPILGVFTVIECRHTLHTLSNQFTLYSFGILMLLVCLYAVPGGLPVRMATGWVAVFATAFVLHRVDARLLRHRAEAPEPDTAD